MAGKCGTVRCLSEGPREGHAAFSHWKLLIAHRSLAMAALTVIAMVACAGQPLYPIAQPPAAAGYRAPYEAVWNATLGSLGVVPPRFVDRAQGRIVTDTFSFTMPVQGGGGGRGGGGVVTQVLSVSMDILVRPTPDGLTAVQAQTTIHQAMEYGFWPVAGGPNSPEGDLFARIASRLQQR